MNENDLNSFIDDIKDLDPIDSKCRAIDLVNYLENSGLNIQDYKYLNFYSNFIGILDESGNLKEEYKYTIDFETDEENIINEDIDSFLMVFEYPKEYLKKSKIKLYHAATEKFPNNVVLNMGVNVGATKMSKPRWSVYCWDHFGSAVSWAMFTVLREFSRSVWDSSLNKFYIAKKDVKKLIGRKCYVYELNVNIRQVSPGTVSSIREYTVNSNVQADKCLEIEITDSLIKKCAHIVEDMDNVKEKEYNRENTVNPKHRGKILVKLLKKTRYKDRNRAFIYRDIQDGRTNYFDDLSKYKKIVNRKYEETEILYEENEILYEDVNIDKLLIFLDKPKERILNKDIRVYHGSPINIKENKLKPYGINVGATSMSTPRWSVFVWDNEESAKKWALSQAINIKVAKVIFRDNEKALIVNSSSMGREEFMNLILNSNIEGYVYESVIPISKLEMGSSSSIREYTISEEMPIDKRKTIKLSNSLFNQYFEIIDEEELNRVQIDRHGTARNSLLNRILDSTRDIQRLIIRKDLRNNKLSIGDDISNYKDRINKGVKNNTFNLPIREEYLYEEASNSKRKLLENKILSSIAIVDKGGLNVDKYKRLFDSMNDAEFNKYMDDFLNDDDKNFYLEILPNKNEPKIKDIEKLLSTLNVPKEEYVYYKHDGFKDDPIRSREQCSVG